MTLKQSYQRSQQKTLNDFFVQNSKGKVKGGSDEKVNFFKQLIKKSASA